MDEKTAFSFANVSKYFGETRAVHDVTLQVKQGEVVGFVGPNGAGKTTAISLLLGFMAPTKGLIHITGQTTPVRPSNAHRSHKSIGYAAGDMAMFDHLTGTQYLDFMRRRHGADKTKQSELIERLKPRLDAPIKSLSRGNRQKIALIGALQHQPPLIILDEPTSGLDPLMQDVFLEIIREQSTAGATVFMSSHILSEVASACSRVLFMKQGKVIIDKSIQEIEQGSGKQIIITAPESVITTSRRQPLPDAHVLSYNDTSLTLVYRGQTAPLLRWLSSRRLDDVSITERSLDDIFKHLYRDDNEEGQS